PAHAGAVRALGLRLEIVSLGLATAPLALARGLVDRRPLQVLLYRRARAVARVRALIAHERFDVGHAQLVRTGAYWPDADGPPVVLDLVDALSETFERRAERDRGPLAWASWIEGRRLRRYEPAAVARAAATLVVAEPDRRALASARVRVVPN